MNYSETLEYLYYKLPMFSNVGCTAFKKDLTNTLILCQHLGNPQEKFKSVHIAGTNGKGSVSHMIAAILQAAGYKTGLYTSPHLKDFRERIRINGAMIPEDYVVRFVEKVKLLIEDVEPSFFEITVAMAFEHFAVEEVDIAVVEVGLGGRLDSTNVLTPELSVITNISFDHTNMLGNTLGEIAVEKAGIIKPDIPVVVGEKHPLTAPVFEMMAHERKALLCYAEDHFAISWFEMSSKYLEVSVDDLQTGNHTSYHLDLPGIYQTKNVITVLAAIEQLKSKGWMIEPQHVFSALQEVKKRTGLSGRWEVIKEKPTVILEVAHNEDGIRQMLDHLKQLRYQRLHIVFGVVKDKDISAILSLLPADALYYFTQAHIPRALDSVQLQLNAREAGLDGNSYEDVNEAIKNALLQASDEDLILVCGSIFLVAEVNKERL